MGVRVLLWDRRPAVRLTHSRPFVARGHRHCCVILGTLSLAAGAMMVFTTVWWWIPGVIMMTLTVAARPWRWRR